MYCVGYSPFLPFPPLPDPFFIVFSTQESAWGSHHRGSLAFWLPAGSAGGRPGKCVKTRGERSQDTSLQLLLHTGRHLLEVAVLLCGCAACLVLPLWLQLSRVLVTLLVALRPVGKNSFLLCRHILGSLTAHTSLSSSSCEIPQFIFFWDLFFIKAVSRYSE